MSFDDKILDDSRSYKAVDDFEALPLSGPGRWAEVAGGTLYTNDSNVLFLQGDGSSNASEVYRYLDKAFKDGVLAPDAFDYVRGKNSVVSGDLSELA